MSAGRPPKSSALRLVEGNRGKRATNKQEPDPPYLNDLTAPDWLPQSARKVWDEVVPHLRVARMLSIVDVPMLCKGCVAIAQYRHATTKMGESLIVEGDGKPAQLNQWMVAQSMAFKQAMAVFQQFGMSPASRTRLAIQPQGDLFSTPATDGKEKASNGYFS